jgi:predicted membrane protein
MSGKNGFAFLLIALGALIVLDRFGLGFGWLMGLLVPLAMIGLGYVGVRNGSKFIGWIVLIIGLFVLLGKLSGLLWIAFAVGFIVYGLSLLKKSSKV